MGVVNTLAAVSICACAMNSVCSRGRSAAIEQEHRAGARCLRRGLGLETCLRYSGQGRVQRHRCTGAADLAGGGCRRGSSLRQTGNALILGLGEPAPCTRSPRCPFGKNCSKRVLVRAHSGFLRSAREVKLWCYQLAREVKGSRIGSPAVERISLKRKNGNGMGSDYSDYSRAVILEANRVINACDIPVWI